MTGRIGIFKVIVRLDCNTCNDKLTIWWLHAQAVVRAAFRLVHKTSGGGLTVGLCTCFVIVPSPAVKYVSIHGIHRLWWANRILLRAGPGRTY